MKRQDEEDLLVFPIAERKHGIGVPLGYARATGVARKRMPMTCACAERIEEMVIYELLQKYVSDQGVTTDANTHTTNSTHSNPLFRASRPTFAEDPDTELDDLSTRGRTDMLHG